MATSKKNRVDTRALMLEAEAHRPKPTEALDVLPDVPDIVETCPTVNAYLCVKELDGKPRKTATITFWVEDCGVKGVFSDRQAKRKLWAEADSLMAFLEALEARLTAKTIDWRSDSGTKYRGRS